MKSHLQVTIESHRFTTRDIIGGDPTLDFVNTVTGRDQSPRDWIDSYSRLLEWAASVPLLPERILRALAKKAAAEPRAAAMALARAKVLREALFEVVTRIISRRAPPKSARDREVCRSVGSSMCSCVETVSTRLEIATALRPSIDRWEFNPDLG